MVPMGDKSVLEHLIALCERHDIKDLAIEVSHMAEKIIDYFGDGSQFNVRITYPEERDLRGTAGALRKFPGFFNETFFVIYGDQVTNLDLRAMYEFHREKKGIGTIFLHKEELVDQHTSACCVVFNEDRRIVEICERPTAADAARLAKIPAHRKTMKTGVYVLEPEIIDLIPEGVSDFSMDTLPAALNRGEIYGFIGPYYMTDIGQGMRYEKAKSDVLSGNVRL
jgi:NDP-sugar pyrophosphorylase family protein